MRESYVNENKHGFKTTNPHIHKIVIVGGKGKLGGLFARFLTLSGYRVETLGSQDWEQAEHILSDCDLVIVCVPIVKTLETIERLQPFLTENMI
ncbi:bifunctional chorismate mutase/prephenate dehydrogenase, partial [Xanthomonas citri pv. citri]|nr:bifunctional chorismate mutase/prephenate dehydrogenase [Xanthomonas citri pv. citri]